jgi:hypothetical protein
MVRCIAAFMDACYIARKNAITAPTLEHFRESVERFHELCNIFIEAGVRANISLPRQHVLAHFYYAMKFFGSPNGLCSLITESKHIRAVKEPWRRSSRYKALIQMLRTIIWMEKMAWLRQTFLDHGMLFGTTSSYTAGVRAPDTLDNDADDDNESAVSGKPSSGALSVVELAARVSTGYPQQLKLLASFIKQPEFPLALQQFLFSCNNPGDDPPSLIEKCPLFEGEIKVYHSATATFYAPSDLCGAGGMRRERIRSTPCFHGHPQRDTVFVVLDDSQPGMDGMEIGRVLLFFSFTFHRKAYSCTLINWFVHGDQPDDDTGMWTVELECDQRGHATLQVIEVETMARAAHLLPVFGSSRVPDDFSHHDALDRFNSFFVNHFVNHHAHEFVTGY